MRKKPALFYKLIFAGTLFDRKPELIRDERTDQQGFDERKMGEGVSLAQEWPEGFTIYVSGTKPVDYFICEAYYRVVSPAFRQIIESDEKNNVEFLPVKMVNPEFGLEFDGYSVMNVISVVDALNWENTVWSIPSVPYNNPDAALYLIKPALTFSKVKDDDIFKILINKIIEPSIFLSNAIREKLIKSKATLGMEFTPVLVIDDR